MVDITNIIVKDGKIYCTMNAISDNCVSDLVIDVKTGDTTALNDGVVSYDMLKARWEVVALARKRKRVPSCLYINWGM